MSPFLERGAFWTRVVEKVTKIRMSLLMLVRLRSRLVKGIGSDGDYKDGNILRIEKGFGAK